MRKVLGFLRRNWRELVWGICFICAIINFATGKRSVIDGIVVILFCIELILKLTIILIDSTNNKALAYKILGNYHQGFYAMKRAHQTRYKLYFAGNSNEIEKYSQLIKDLGKILISYREDDFTQKVLSSEQMKHVEELDSLVKQMLITENPNMIKGFF